MSDKANSLFRGAFLRLSEFGLNAIVGIMLTPFIISSLGDQMYGIWIVVGSFLGFYGLMDFGLSSAVQRYTAKAIGNSDFKSVNRVVNTTFFIYTILGAIIFICSIFIAIIFPFLIKNLGDGIIFRKVVIILGLSFALGFPLKVFGGVLSANIRYDLSSTIELVKLVIRTGLVIFLLKHGYGLIGLAVLTFFVDLTSSLSKYFVVRRLYSYIKISFSAFDFAKIKELFNYSFFTFISQIADQMRFNIDNFVIVTFVGLNAVTVYSIGSRLIEYFKEFMLSVVGMTLPIFSQYEGSGDFHSVRKKYIFLTKISAYISFVVGGIAVILGHPFIIRWVGKSFEPAYLILIILLIPFLFDTMQIPGGGMLFGLSKHKYYSFSNTIEGLANFCLSIFLVRRYGIQGVALGTAIPMIIMKVFIQPLYTCRVIQLNWKIFYSQIMIPCLAISGITLMIFYALVKNVIYASYFNIFLFGILGVCFCFPLIVLFGFSKEERNYFDNLLKKKRE